MFTLPMLFELKNTPRLFWCRTHLQLRFATDASSLACFGTEPSGGWGGGGTSDQSERASPAGTISTLHLRHLPNVWRPAALQRYRQLPAI